MKILPFGALIGTFGSQTTPKCSKIAQTGCLGPFELILGIFAIFRHFRLFSPILVDFSS
jgi:hypothetical protein